MGVAVDGGDLSGVLPERSRTDEGDVVEASVDEISMCAQNMVRTRFSPLLSLTAVTVSLNEGSIKVLGRRGQRATQPVLI